MSVHPKLSDYQWGVLVKLLTVSGCRGMLGVLDSMSKAADAICDGNVVEKHVRSQNDWGLLPTQVSAV